MPQLWVLKETTQKTVGNPSSAQRLPNQLPPLQGLLQGQRDTGPALPPRSQERCSSSCCICSVHRCGASHSIRCRGTHGGLGTWGLHPVLLAGWPLQASCEGRPKKWDGNAGREGFSRRQLEEAVLCRLALLTYDNCYHRCSIFRTPFPLKRYKHNADTRSENLF